MAAPVPPACAPTPIQSFGVVVPGRALICNWMPTASPTTFTALIERPATVPELTFFSLPATVIPAGYGAALYYSSNGQTWELLGAIYEGKPSGVFRTGWTTNEDIAPCPVVQLAVTVEPLETIKNLDMIYSGVEDRFAFAHKIAQDLFQYMTSFGSMDATNNANMIVPTNVFDRWMERFTRKYRQDPNFMMKQ